MGDGIVEGEAPVTAGGQGNAMTNVLKLRDFRLLWIGQGTSLIGDQFYLVALPWLVLRLTNDPLTLGLVLAMAGIPRAVFMLVGGAITDRFSPRTVMLLSDVIRLLFTLVLVALVITDTTQVWMLYILSLAFGLISGFFMPASNAIVPGLVEGGDLQAGNAIFQGTAWFSSFVGPVLAGGLIAWGGHTVSSLQGGDGGERLGIALAFGIDAVSFAVSILTLWLMQLSRPVQPDGQEEQDLLVAIQQGIAFAWQEPLHRVLFALLAAMNLLLVGPTLVGIPVIASSRLTGGAAAYGLILSGYAGGNLLGFFFAGSLPRLKNIGRLTPLFLGLFGVGLVALGMVFSTWVDFAILFVLGIANGYIAILVITWIQQRTPKELLGRVMSLMLFFNVGLVPVSQAVAGAVSKWSVTALFGGSGAGILLIAAWSGLLPVLRNAEI